jgi:uroporphyrinogen decarboxylase
LDKKELSEMQPISENDGRIPVVLNAMRNLSETYPDVAFYGLVTGPFTLALHLRGTGIFMDIYDQPEYVQKLLAFTTQIGINMADFYLNAGCDVIAVVDPMTSQISPQTFGEFVTPAAQKVFAHIRNREALSSFFVCGHAQKNVEAMCMTNPDNICIDENIDLNYVKEVTRKYNVSYGGNLKLTLSLLMGNENDVNTYTVYQSPLAGKTIQLGVIAPGPASLETEVPLYETIVTPSINEYVSTLGYDIEFEFLIDQGE